MSFGRPEITLSDFGGSWRQVGNVMIFERFPGGPRVERTRQSDGKSLVRGPTKQLTAKQLKAKSG